MKIDYIDVTLTKSEKKLLKRIASSKKMTINDLDSIGNFIPLNTVSISREYERYKVVKRTLF